MNTKLTILQITNRIPYPLNDGGNIATYNVTKYLNKLGHKVIMASLNTKKHFQDPTALSAIAEVHATAIDTSLSILGMAKGLFQKLPYNVSRFISEDFEQLLIKILQEQKPDIIHIEGIYLVIYADIIRKHSTAPLILRSHNIEHEIWKRTAENEKNILKKWYLKNLSAKIKNFELEKMHLFDAIIAITDRDAAFYKTYQYKGKLKTISAGVDLELYQPKQLKSNKPSISFLGSMEWMPNIQGVEWYLEKVWPTLRKSFPELTLHIAGKNMSSELKNRIIDGVTFHGTIPDAAEFLTHHTFMIVPLLSGGGMRLKIVEAMALGRCIISTSIGAEGIEATDNIDIVIANNAEEFITKTTTLLNGNINTDTLGDNGKRLVQEKYSWEKLVQKMENYYFELI